RHERHERVPMLFPGHPLELVEVDGGGGQAQHVCALERAADTALADHSQDARVDEPGDVPVKTRRGHVRELDVQIGCGERAVAQEGLDDPQADGVQKQISGGHAPTLSLLVTLSSMRSTKSSKRKRGAAIAGAMMFAEAVGLWVRTGRPGGNIV